MTDNEKRAHDLAIVICADTVRIKTNAQLSAGKTEINVDYFAEYLNAYNAALEAFSKQFPDAK